MDELRWYHITVCLDHIFEHNCSLSCKDCMNGGKCQEGKSECSCPAGCRVILCNENCLEGAYGAGCTSECQCVEENTLECSAKNGSCTCKSGYQGNRCQKDGLWGPEGWFSSAPCENGGQCNKKTGNCDLTPDYTRKSCTILFTWHVWR
ncbi:putative EGF-like and EMI domain-containing protein 1 isoform X2 [Pan troglodytes]|uniref:putative EGF-like and EMI domain-containing protein 1 isoform X2 n=2 Tax=Pan troglodytes TaxID=9598 RepID=UPI0030135265